MIKNAWYVNKEKMLLFFRFFGFGFWLAFLDMWKLVRFFLLMNVPVMWFDYQFLLIVDYYAEENSKNNKKPFFFLLL